MSPCTEAIVKDVLTLRPENTVLEALDIFKKNNIRSLPVVDNQGKFCGIFGLKHILLKLLPKSVTMEDGLESLDFIQGATPGIAKRLKKLYPQAVLENMDSDPVTIDSHTALWEAVRVMAVYGSPIAIVNEETKKFEGVITRLTLLDRLEKIISELDDNDDQEDEI